MRGSQKVTSDDEGEGGSRYPPKMMTSFMNSPLWINDPFLEIFTSERLFQRIVLEMVNINFLVFPNGNVRFRKIAILGI